QTAVAEAAAVGDERIRYLHEILGACGRVADRVAGAKAERRLPIVLGGDHSVALGTLGGLARESGVGGVLWVDAHGDLNRPETSTGWSSRPPWGWAVPTSTRPASRFRPSIRAGLRWSVSARSTMPSETSSTT